MELFKWIPTESFGLSVYLLDKINAGEQVHSEINELPVDAFFGVLFLFKYEHVMVEELLEFFIGKVNAKLLKTVELRK